MITEEKNIDMPSFYHSAVQSNLVLALAEYTPTYRFLSQPTLLLNKWESEPDLAIIPKRPITNWLIDQVKIKEVPLAVIEIISPRQGTQDITEKCIKYFEAGVKSCWVLNPILLTVYVYSSETAYDVFTQKAPEIVDTSLNIRTHFDKIFT